MSAERSLDTALVLGATGFWGSWLTDRLVREGVEVTGVARGAGRTLAELAGPTHFVEADLRETRPEDYLGEFDAVFFLAGVASVPGSVANPIGDLFENAVVPLRILEVLRASHSRTPFIYASSAAVYGTALEQPMSEQHTLNPMSPYGIAKLASERYLGFYAREFGIQSAAVRPFSLYGPGQAKQVVYDLARRIAAEESPIAMLGSPDVSRDFFYVADACAAMLAIARRGALEGEAYNLASGTETQIGQLVTTLLDVAGHSAPVEFSGAVRIGDPQRWRGDISALAELGFQPETSLEDGLRATYAWVADPSSEH